METSWQNITRRLDINQVNKDTTYDKTRSKGRNITKVSTEIIVPAYEVNLLTVYPPEIYPARIVAQYNFSASKAFRLLGVGNYFNDTTLTTWCRLAIRYRVGEIGYRYGLTKLKLLETGPDYEYGSPSTCDPLMNVPDYTNQRIEPEFCIELWTHRFFTGSLPIGGILVGLHRNLTLQTNLLDLPVDVNLTPNSIPLSETLHDTVEDNMAQDAASETLPIDYAGSWNTN